MTPERTQTEYFIDTSALLKAYVPEKGSDAMDLIFQENAVRRISDLALIETMSVFQRLHSVENSLTKEQFDALCCRLLDDVASGRIVTMNLTPLAVQRALVLEMHRYLTAVDAVHIALAEETNDAVFVSSDEKLNNAAREIGLKVVDPSI